MNNPHPKKGEGKEIEATKFLIKSLKKGYGADCETSDLDDWDVEIKANNKLSEAVMHSGRCASCRARETILFLEEHLDLLKT